MHTNVFVFDLLDSLERQRHAAHQAHSETNSDANGDANSEANSQTNSRAHTPSKSHRCAECAL